MIASKHYLRRRARITARELDRHAEPGVNYVVEKAVRGPFRWHVVRKVKP